MIAGVISATNEGVMMSDEKLTQRRMIKEWLEEEKAAFSVAKGVPNMSWGLMVQQPPPYAVSQAQDAPHRININSDVVLSNYKHDISQLPEKEKKRLFYELKMFLLRTGVYFSIELDLSQIKVETRLFTDSMNRAGFWSSVFQVQRTILGIFAILDYRFDSVKQDFPPINDGDEH